MSTPERACYGHNWKETERHAPTYEQDVTFIMSAPMPDAVNGNDEVLPVAAAYTYAAP